jgi:hypothetical protein
MNSLNFIFCASSDVEVEILISSVYQTTSSILMKDYLKVFKTGVIKLKHCNKQKQK